MGPRGSCCGACVRSTPHTPWGREPRMPRPAGPQPRAPTARASRDDSRQGPTPHRAAPDLSLVRWRPRSLRTQPSWRRWLAWPRLGGAHAPAAFQFMSWLALLPPFCNSGAVAFFGGAAILLPARRSVGAVFGLAWRIPPHSDAACGRHAWASCPGAPDAQVLFGCDAACFLCGWDAQGVVLLRSPSWLGRRPPSIQSPLLAEHARSSQSPLLAEHARSIQSPLLAEHARSVSRLCSPSMRRHRCSPSKCCGRDARQFTELRPFSSPFHDQSPLHAPRASGEALDAARARAVCLPVELVSTRKCPFCSIRPSLLLGKHVASGKASDAHVYVHHDCHERM